MHIVYRYMMERSQKGPIQWTNVSGIWVGVQGRDTTQVALGNAEFGDISLDEVKRRAAEIKKSPDLSAALQLAHWNPAEYVMSTQVASQAAFFDSIHRDKDEAKYKATLETVAKDYKSTMRPAALAFVRAHGAQLNALGFARAGVQRSEATSSNQ